MTQPSLKERVLKYLVPAQGRRVSLKDVRHDLKIEPGSTDDDNLRQLFSRTLVKERIVTPSGYNDGSYRVVKQVTPVRVFIPDRTRRPPFKLIFPKDFNTGMELDFAPYIVVREGDLITLGGVKSKGKTLLCLGFTSENIDFRPILMGNEYTQMAEDGGFDVAPRFLDRLDTMSEWVEWTNGNGEDKFTLLPVSGDYAEHIEQGKLNIIDWINLDGDRQYDIGKVLEGIKKNLGKGVAIVALQKGEGAINPRGGQFVRDFSDVEIILDGFGEYDDDILLTIKGAKEKTKPIVGKTYAYSIAGRGTKIINFREVKKCPHCRATGWVKGVKCDTCLGKKYIDAITAGVEDVPF